jgi:hypothetical protein
MDSSSYTINAGQPVTFTANVMGNNGTPTGTITFRDNGVAIAGCSSVALSGGKATCTTSALAAGKHPITGLYSGNATYSSGVAGPITQTVVGVVGTTLTIDSSRYTSTLGQNVTFTVKVTGNGTPTGTVNFTDNASSIAGCASVSLNSNGVAKCTTNGLARGSHAIKGLYSGNGSNSAGVAGPITQTVN